MASSPGPYRRLPQVHRLAASLPSDIPLVWRVEAARRAVEAARQSLREHPEHADAVLARVPERARLEAVRLARPHLRPVINATGVILHTNLGRAPLGQAALDHIAAVARGYSTLEFDVERGERGSRHSHVEDLLTALSGAEAAMVVNNNAAAVFLALAELAHDREVVVSRGQLVEIGGAFRIPDVMAASGARLVEVGTTNKTRLSDYERAIGPATALLLKVHTSNFRLEGFVEQVETADLVRLGHARGLPVMEDLGSGVLFPLTVGGWREPSVSEVVQAGADVVTFSGDKLLGGPQAGLIVGRAELIRRMKRHPLARALRVDKLTLAGLETTLRLYREGRTEDIPLWHMLNQSPETLWRRARRLERTWLRAAAAAGVALAVRAAREASVVGGGSLPGVTLPTAVVRIRAGAHSAARLEERLRQGEPPVVGRVSEDAVVLDLRTVAPAEERDLGAAVLAAARPE
ncbi:MAG: L-seryl-tRNA(Sec) selenium transferase [Actinomycetia bacterium]|nr:L-seryl-tRNA(Sec) selenium transferase [Actinomycetes bacterium]